MTYFGHLVGSSILAGAVLVGAALPAAAVADTSEGIVTATNGSVTVKGHHGSVTTVYNPGPQIDAANSGIALSGGGIQSTSRVGGAAVEFQNGVIVGGPGSTATAFTEVQVTYTNTLDIAVTPTLNSSINPTGLGFLISDIFTGGSCTTATLGGCGQTTNPVTFGNVGTGTAGFAFDILSDGVTIYHLAGGMAVLGDGSIDASGMAAASVELTGYQPSTVAGDPTAVGFKWDKTLIQRLLPTLAAHASSTLTYRTQTYASVTGPCANATTASGTCLIGYSVFGDPTKIGTGISSMVDARGMQLGLSAAAGSTGITGIVFNTLAPLYLPTFDPVTGTLDVFLPTTDDGLIPPPVVPEPASWAMMIAGFAMVGSALRRRRHALA